MIANHGLTGKQLAALKIALWWHTQHDTSSDRTPLARMVAKGKSIRLLGSWSRADAVARAARSLLGAVTLLAGALDGEAEAASRLRSRVRRTALSGGIE